MLGFQRAEQPACPTFPGSAFMFGVQPICPSVLRYHRPRPSPGQGLKKGVVLLNWEVQTTPPPRDPDRPLGGGTWPPPKRFAPKHLGFFLQNVCPKSSLNGLFGRFWSKIFSTQCRAPPRIGHLDCVTGQKGWVSPAHPGWSGPPPRPFLEPCGRGSLAGECQEGKWWPVAASAPLILKPVVQLPRPLWREILELCGGELARVARAESGGE